MASLIQLKRSQVTSIPPELEEGEPAWTGNGNVLFIGSNNEIIAIAGRRYPGTLTANQAIVTNSNNMIDTIMFGNTTVNSVITSSSIQLQNSTVSFSLPRPTSAQMSGNFILSTTGWTEPGSGGSANPGGANTNIQFNNEGSFGGTSAFTFNNTTNTVSIGANVQINTSHYIVGNSTVNTQISSAGITIGSSVINSSTISTNDMEVSGNLIVSGELVTVDANTIVVQDPMIKLSYGQANTGTFIDFNDIGYYGSYGNTSQTNYTGLFRDASDNGIFKLFHGEIPEPGLTVDTSDPSFALSTLQAYLKSGIFISNATSVSITANSTVNCNISANTLSLSSALTVTSGGTGRTTISPESILVGNSTNGFADLAIGANGQFLQVINNELSYGMLDGGTF